MAAVFRYVLMNVAYYFDRFENYERKHYIEFLILN